MPGWSISIPRTHTERPVLPVRGFLGRGMRTRRAVRGHGIRQGRSTERRLCRSRRHPSSPPSACPGRSVEAGMRTVSDRQPLPARRSGRRRPEHPHAPNPPRRTGHTQERMQVQLTSPNADSRRTAAAAAADAAHRVVRPAHGRPTIRRCQRRTGEGRPPVAHRNPNSSWAYPRPARRIATCRPTADCWSATG